MKISRSRYVNDFCERFNNSLVAWIVVALAVFTPNLISFFSAETKGATMELTSSAFQSGAVIPRKHTCDAEDVSPGLGWSKAPPDTKAFALIVDDPDAPGGTWVHWLIYDLNAHANELPESVTTKEMLPNGAKQGLNDFRKVGYGGPCPPPGPPHRYSFRLYALSEPTKLKPRAIKKLLLAAMKGHVLSHAELVGRYQR